MAWQRIQLAVQGAQAGVWSEALSAVGALSVEITDACLDQVDETPIFGEPSDTSLLEDGLPPVLWSKNLVIGLFSEATQLDQLVIQLAAILREPLPEYMVEMVEERDWVRITQSQFSPISVDGLLWIVPSWHQPVDPSAINIVLDPGMAFGTGSHPTTKLCLRWLVHHLCKGEAVLDYGCGSGILAIAAAKLGATRVVGVDLDPQAVQAATYNAEQNQVGIRWMQPSETATGVELVALESQFDLLIANILTNPLKSLAADFARFLKPGGKIVLSGILAEQVEGDSGIKQVYSTWFSPLQVWASEEGWVCLEGFRHHNG